MVSAPRRPRFRDRPHGWWLLALAGHYAAAPRVSPAAGWVQHAPRHGEEAAPTAPSAQPSGVQRRRRRRGLLAAALALILLGAGLSRLLAPASSATGPSSTPAPVPAPVAFAPVAGPPATALAMLGTKAALAEPREAVALPDGRIAVADTGNGRLVLLDAAGHLLRAVHSGAAPLQQPYALVVARGGLDVLDAERGSIERFDGSGHFVRELVQDPALRDGRGLAMGLDGRLYVANPLTNSIVVLSADGQIERQISSPLGAGPGQFNQPSDVAVGADGTLYVLDNQNNRIEALTPAGAFVAQWPAPPSDTLHSVHLLPLAGGRLLASDPSSGALLLYRPGGGSPTREPLQGAGQAPAQPLGLALMPHGQVLVTDSGRGQLLVVPAPR